MVQQIKDPDLRSTEIKNFTKSCKDARWITPITL